MYTYHTITTGVPVGADKSVPKIFGPLEIAMYEDPHSKLFVNPV